MRPNDFMMYGDEGMIYNNHLKDLARRGVPSSEMPSFKQWQESKLEEIAKKENIPPRKSKHGFIKLIAFGLAAYLAFRAYNACNNSRDKYFGHKENTTENHFLNEGSSIGDVISHVSGVSPLSEAEIMKDRVRDAGRRVSKELGIEREMKMRGEQDLYRKFKEWKHKPEK